MNQYIENIQNGVQELMESTIRLQVLNEQNLKCYEEMLKCVKQMEGDK